jgi:hypothetical protein
MSPLEQIYFPVPLPFLDLLFAAKCRRLGFMGLKPNQSIDFVSLGEAGNQLVLVLPDSPYEIVRRADVKRPVRFAGGR